MRAPNKSQEEFAEVFAHVERMARPEMYRLMLLLTVRLGLRPMEIAGLESSWFRGSELRIPLGYSKRKTGRSLPVDGEVLAALQAWMGTRQGRVFQNKQGQAFDAKGISSALRRLYREAGQQGSAYSGRRTLATRLVEQNVSILTIQRILGHSSPVTTMHYCSVTENMMRNALRLAA